MAASDEAQDRENTKKENCEWISQSRIKYFTRIKVFK